MKTIKEIDKDIKAAHDLATAIRNKEEEGRESTVIAKIIVYRKARIYMEGSPLKEHVVSQKKLGCKRLKDSQGSFRRMGKGGRKERQVTVPKEGV